MEEIETTSLLFQPGNYRRDGFRWVAVYDNIMVGLCNRRFCEICNFPEREKLKDFHGGKLEVRLTLQRWPSFWEERLFYYGHLISVPEKVVVEVDEGIEFDVSRSNAFLYTTSNGAILVDPGWAGFNGQEFPLRQLVTGQRVVATLITHGHLDHWSQLSEIRGPVFMSQGTFKLASRHAFLQRDQELVKTLREARQMTPGQPVILRDLPVKIETIPLPHSIPETTGLIIRGERARVVHLGDFKFNGMEVRKKAETIAQFREVAKDKIDLLALNIINAHIEGFTPLESLVIDAITNVLAKAKGRVIVACFSTNLERIRRIIEIAQVLGRPVLFDGSGMRNSQELLGMKNGDRNEAEQAVIFVTGCQGEESSVLWRIAKKEETPFELRSSDTLIFSSRCIPGNEENLRQLVAEIRPKVGKVIVSKGEIEQLGLNDSGVAEELIHVSGHEAKEGLRLALEILRPEKVLPWPQLSPQIEAFREIAEPLGIKIMEEKERIIEI